MSSIASLAMQVDAVRSHLDRQAGHAVQVAAAGKAAEAEIAVLGARADLCAKTAAVLTSVGEEAQENARAVFEDLATRALQAIFGDGLSFRLVPGEAGGQAVLEPVIRSEHADGTAVETPVMDARGGGMVVVVGFVLRLVMVLLTPGARKVLFLDETFAHVGASYRRPLAEFLRETADRTGVQIVMITHDDIYAEYADALLRFSLGPDGMTRISEEESE